MTNGPVEGINNKLRVIARRAYGFHSHGALISMLFLCCGSAMSAPSGSTVATVSRRHAFRMDVPGVA